MTKKIILSVAASALLATSAFAGTMTVGQDHKVLSTESYMQNGADEVNMTSVTYTPNFNVQNRPSGTITDTKLELDVNDVIFPISKTNDLLGTDYDENGTGIAASDLTIAELDAMFAGTYWNDSHAAPAPDLPFHHATHHAVTGHPVLVFTPLSGTNPFYKGHTYIFTDPSANGTPGELSFKWEALTGSKLYIKTYSTTLDDSYVDSAEIGKDTKLTPQFSVACVRKFDGLINFENDRVSFVNPEHGERVGNKPLLTPNDTLITNDRMIFTLSNARKNDATRWMGGHATQFSFTADNNNNAFETWTTSTVKIYHTQANPDNVNTDAVAVLPSFGPIVLAPGTRDTVLPTATGTFVYDAATKRFTVTYPDAALQMGLTTFVVDLLKPATDLPLRAVKFVPAGTDMEAGLNPADDTRSDIVQNGHPTGPNHYVINDEDDSVVIAPQNQTTPVPTDAGKWMDHAYIAQIAGGSSTKNADNANGMQTKLFIVNRSCAPVIPVIKLVKNGSIIPLTGVNSIDPDSQGFFDIGALLDGMTSGSANGSTYAQYAIEVTLPGVAEDFYMYAQVKNKTLGQFKDLPVYNTSNRD